MFSGAGLARADGLIMIAMRPPPVSRLWLGGRSIIISAGVPNLPSSPPLRCSPSPMARVRRKNHHATQRRSIRSDCQKLSGLIADRRFVVPAATVSLIMAAVLDVFSAARAF